jgi:hypothetical protein
VDIYEGFAYRHHPFHLWTYEVYANGARNGMDMPQKIHLSDFCSKMFCSVGSSVSAMSMDQAHGKGVWKGYIAFGCGKTEVKLYCAI